MAKSDKDSYDAVIIGAGLSGLVCGCYLAKAGMKVLVAEQHHKPGGYCTSFKRGGFTFDAAAHSFGGYRKDGIVRKVFNDLQIAESLKITRSDPSDVIMSPDCEVSFRSDLDKTIQSFQRAYPDESDNINYFFRFANNPDRNFFFRIRNWTFQDLLDNYFKNDKLKSILSFPLFGNGALPPSLMSALIGAKIFQEFLLDGGYYPDGGMQMLPDALAIKFRELGGEIRLSCPVKKIRINSNKVTGIVTEQDGPVASTYVISNCDARQTFLELLGRENVHDDVFLNNLNNMFPSLSIFILYLGLAKPFVKMPQPGVNTWLLTNYNLDDTYLLRNRVNFGSVCAMARVTPDKKTIVAFANVPFKNKNYWIDNKERLMNSFIDKIEESIIPGLSDHIIYREAATPHTLYRYTLNYEGAAYGWACTPSQVGLPGFRKPSFIQGLYLTGHWTTQGLGIPGVFYIGHDTARLILKKEKRQNQHSGASSMG